MHTVWSLQRDRLSLNNMDKAFKEFCFSCAVTWSAPQGT